MSNSQPERKVMQLVTYQISFITHRKDGLQWWAIRPKIVSTRRCLHLDVARFHILGSAKMQVVIITSVAVD